ncbi:hypothetical protein BGW80DRAFT_1319704 [Lactifluus volemus]|nr:hypothetical protein BGW80DRAFT_1319704 [Lactifluus volemus]
MMSELGLSQSLVSVGSVGGGVALRSRNINRAVPRINAARHFAASATLAFLSDILYVVLLGLK